MKRIKQYIIFNFLLLFMCSNMLFAQLERGKDFHAYGEDIYKHYMGTIGDKKVVMDLRYGYCGASNYGGSSYYYFGKEGIHHFFILQPASFDYERTLRCEEREEEKVFAKEKAEEGLDNPILTSTMEIKIVGDKLTGKWHSADMKRTYDIKLREDYSKSYPMDMVFFRDSMTDNYLISVKPAPETNKTDADFIVSEELKFLEDGKAGTDNWPDYLNSLFGKHGGSHMTTFMPVFNSNNILVMGKNAYFLFPANTSSLTYLCLDILNKKQISLNDIIQMDTAKLSSLLEAAARKKYDLMPGKKLAAWFRFDKMPVTDNIIITDKGIFFSYDLNKVISETYYKDNMPPSREPISLFLSYAQLKDILKEDFKKRMGLNPYPSSGARQ